MNGNRITIEIEGADYPCAVSMGAFQDYYDATGKEAQDGMSIRESGVWLWACVKSACEKEKKPFGYEVKEFLNATTPDVLALWSKAMVESMKSQGTAESKDSKKKRKA